MPEIDIDKHLSNPPDFLTHLHYFMFLANLSHKIEVSSKTKVKNRISKIQDIDKKIASDEYLKYYCYYYQITAHFYNALSKLINQLSLIRFNTQLLKEK